jgi:hypothetical protein
VGVNEDRFEGDQTMKWMKWILVGLSIAGLLWLGLFLRKFFVKPVVPVTPVVVVTPQPITPAVQHQLPGGQTAHTQIDIPPIVNQPGHTATQHVVATDQGNTLVVTTYKVKLGFLLDPIIFVGYDRNSLVGIGLSVFQYWRFTIDGLALLEMGDDSLLQSFGVGGGLSYQLNPSFSVGGGYVFKTSGEHSPLIYLSVRF